MKRLLRRPRYDKWASSCGNFQWKFSGNFVFFAVSMQFLIRTGWDVLRFDVYQVRILFSVCFCRIISCHTAAERKVERKGKTPVWLPS